MSTIAVPTTGRATGRATGRGGVPVAVASAARRDVADRRQRYWHRRLGAIVVLVAAAFLLTVVVGRVGAEAELADRVAGHAVVEPGDTLWDVAVATAPDGIDARRQLADLKELNGLTSSQVDPWTVILLPAR